MASKPQKDNKSQTFLHYTGMSLQMILTIIIFVLLGKYLDSQIKLSFPIGLLILTIIGVVLSMYFFIRKL